MTTSCEAAASWLFGSALTGGAHCGVGVDERGLEPFGPLGRRLAVVVGEAENTAKRLSRAALRAAPGPAASCRIKRACDEPATRELEIEGLPVYWIDEVDRFSATHRAVCALGTTTRSRVIEEAGERGLLFTAIVHPRARVSTRSEFGEGSVASVNVVVAANARVGRHVILNRGASIGHDTVVGDYVTIGPGVNVAGLCSIGDGCYVGIGATIVDRIAIGPGSVVGAGAVVTKGRGAEGRGPGIPARVHKERVEGR